MRRCAASASFHIKCRSIWHLVRFQDQDLPETPNVKLSVAPNGMILTKHNPAEENDIKVHFKPNIIKKEFSNLCSC